MNALGDSRHPRDERSEVTKRASRRGVGRKERGSVMAEFALILPILLIVLFGIIEFAIAFNRAQAIEAAAREGARLASISTTSPSDVEARVNLALVGIPLDGPVTVAVSPGGCAGREGQAITVNVSSVKTVTIPLLFTRNVTLNGEAVFRCEA